MTPEQWKQLDDLFDRAQALPPSEREAFARAQCATDDPLCKELLSLLQADQSGEGLFEAPLANVGPLIDHAPGAFDEHDILIGRRMAAYTVESVLGRGGMGVVYKARQDSPHRTVALKVINPGAIGGSSLRRFQREAEVLGRLQHPGVAQIYESGQSRTPLGLQPFFAMEFVDGRPLLDYAKEHQLSNRQRLELMSQICDAVQFAHLKGVIHRDLKPVNILVDSRGHPKILDFGIARLTDSDIRVTTIQTNVGQLIGTIPYMSPEQATGDSREIDTRSDVYALGVVLYELLSGRLPYDLREKPVTEAVRVVTEQDPTRLSSISRIFRGDIETIVGKALEKDRTRRYQSAADMAADIRRFLADQAITARPASTVYQFRKFARRNRTLVGGVICAMILLVAGVIGTGIGLVRAVDAEHRAKDDATKARREARMANEATSVLQGMLNAANPESGRRADMTVRELLLQTSADLEAQAGAQPEVAAAVHFTVGSAFVGMEDYTLAAGHLSRALELRKQVFGDKGWRVANCYHKLGQIAFEQGDRSGGLASVRHGIELLNADPGALWEDAAIHELDYSQMLNTIGDFPLAEQASRRAIDLATSSGGKEHGVTAAAIASLAAIYMSQGQHARAEPFLREAMDIAKKVYGPKSSRIATNLIDLGKTLNFLSRDAEAEPLLAEAVEIRRVTYGPDHPKTAVPLEQLANCQMVLKKLTAAESSAREALRIRRAVDADSADTVNAIQVLCKVLQRQNRLDDAEPLALQALDIRMRILGEDNKLTAQSMETLGELLFKQKKYDQAKDLLLRAVAIRRKVQGERHVLVSNGLRTLGQMCSSIGESESAVTYYSQAVSLLSEAFKEDHAVLVGTRLALASNQSKLHRYDDAEATYRLALAGLRKRHGDTGPGVADCLTALAGVLKAKGDTKAADEVLAQAAQAKPAPAAAPESPESGG